MFLELKRTERTIYIKMKRNIIILIVCIASFSGFTQPSTNSYGSNPEAGNYADVNGIKVYYEIYGSGLPLLILHGNGGSIRSQSPNIDYFKASYKVIAPDLRAHGKTEDPGDSLTYNDMTKDINDLLDKLGIDSCFVLGQSDGGIIGLKLAMDYPKKVKKVAVYGANIQPDSTAIQNALIEWGYNIIETTKDMHQKRLYTLMKYQPRIEASKLRTIKAPVLLMSGDRDAIKLQHTIEIFKNIENSNLFIMPGATHFGGYEKADLFHNVVNDFFTKPFSKISTLDYFK